jgi:hypothetical protein
MYENSPIQSNAIISLPVPANITLNTDGTHKQSITQLVDVLSPLMQPKNQAEDDSINKDALTQSKPTPKPNTHNQPSADITPNTDSIHEQLPRLLPTVDVTSKQTGNPSKNTASDISASVETHSNAPSYSIGFVTFYTEYVRIINQNLLLIVDWWGKHTVQLLQTVIGNINPTTNEPIYADKIAMELFTGQTPTDGGNIPTTDQIFTYEKKLTVSQNKQQELISDNAVVTIDEQSDWLNNNGNLPMSIFVSYIIILRKKNADIMGNINYANNNQVIIPGLSIAIRIITPDRLQIVSHISDIQLNPVAQLIQTKMLTLRDSDMTETYLTGPTFLLLLRLFVVIGDSDYSNVINDMISHIYDAHTKMMVILYEIHIGMILI